MQALHWPVLNGGDKTRTSDQGRGKHHIQRVSIGHSLTHPKQTPISIREAVEMRLRIATCSTK